MEVQIDPGSDRAQRLIAWFRVMGAEQAAWQRKIGFGEEGDRLRRDLDNDGPDAEDALRNYYITKLALIMTEAAEAIEELRGNHALDELYFDENGKPMGVPSELADLVIRVWSLTGEADIDLGPAIITKLNYNANRAYRHGGKGI